MMRGPSPTADSGTSLCRSKSVLIGVILSQSSGIVDDLGGV